VKEVEIETSNPFVGLLNRIFATERKLKPIIKKRQPIAFESVKECKIFVHIIKAENVPVRAECVQRAHEYKKNESKLIYNNRPVPNRPQNQLDLDEQEEVVEDDQTGKIKDEQQLYSMPMVETFVEVKIIYHEKFSIVKRTNVDEGTMPKWNEVL
jgi:hypothetical protein